MKDQSFFYRDGDRLKQLDIDTIAYVQAKDNYCIFHTALKKNTYTIRISIAAAVRLLPSAKFIRINRSDIVAISHIEHFKKDEVLLKEPKISLLLTKQYYDILLKKIVLLYTPSNKHNKKDELLTWEEYRAKRLKELEENQQKYQKKKAAKEAKRLEQQSKYQRH
ncbi:LytR/AlgR family response regulator transcription factor [Paraflavitalea pollutisoli]|uniref:LytR/AlgR family response regulator transcription factor n=1 Tax=Paraflavitalea pollutisoli TaxID=3034143 RepID=UPI0023EB3B30|nr:LytTR family DNA-binding domain-containing protein [Paraflavitalea sp. H1-2-19X]